MRGSPNFCFFVCRVHARWGTRESSDANSGPEVREFVSVLPSGLRRAAQLGLFFFAGISKGAGRCLPSC